MSTPRVVVGIALWWCAWAVRSFACDSTSCAVVTRGRDGVASAGSFRLDVSVRHYDLTRRISADPSSGQVLVPWIDFRNSRLVPGYHVEGESGHSIVQLDGSYGVTSRLTLTASLPLVRRSFAYSHARRPTAVPGTSDADHEHAAAFVSGEQRYQTSGIGDVQPGLRYAVRVARTSRLVAGVAVRIPTGPYEETDVSRTIHSPLFQPASGAWAGIVSAQYSRQAAGADWSFTGSYQKNGASSRGFRFGDDAFVAAGVTGKLSGRMNASLQVKLARSAGSRFLGAAVPSTGGTLAYVTPGARFDLPAQMSLYVFLPVPVYESLKGPQLLPRFSVLAGISKEF